MNETLSKTEQIALHGASEALVIIRKLASSPITPESQKAIYDLADAFHNVPAHCAGPAQQREANAFLIDAALRHAARICLEHGFTFTPALPALSAEELEIEKRLMQFRPELRTDETRKALTPPAWS